MPDPLKTGTLFYEVIRAWGLPPLFIRTLSIGMASAGNPALHQLSLSCYGYKFFSL